MWSCFPLKKKNNQILMSYAEISCEMHYHVEVPGLIARLFSSWILCHVILADRPSLSNNIDFNLTHFLVSL